MNWTRDMDATLTAGWIAGLSAPEIATIIGGVSGSAVRGRRVFMGLPDREDGAMAFAGRFKAGYRPATVGAKKTPTLKAAPMSRPRPFGDRGAFECALPIGDGEDMRACCATVGLGRRRP